MASRQILEFVTETKNARIRPEILELVKESRKKKLIDTVHINFFFNTNEI